MNRVKALRILFTATVYLWLAALAFGFSVFVAVALFGREALAAQVTVILLGWAGFRGLCKLWVDQWVSNALDRFDASLAEVSQHQDADVPPTNQP